MQLKHYKNCICLCVNLIMCVALIFRFRCVEFFEAEDLNPYLELYCLISSIHSCLRVSFLHSSRDQSFRDYFYIVTFIIVN